MADPIAGDTLEFTLTFTDVDSNSLIDPPGEILFVYKVQKTGTPTVHSVKSTDPLASPILAFTHPSVGTYVVLVDSTGLDGVWTVEAATGGTGAGIVLAISPAESFTVDPPAMVPAF